MGDLTGDAIMKACRPCSPSPPSCRSRSSRTPLSWTTRPSSASPPDDAPRRHGAPRTRPGSDRSCSGPTCCSTSVTTASRWPSCGSRPARRACSWAACAGGATSTSNRRPARTCANRPRTVPWSGSRRAAGGPNRCGPSSRTSWTSAGETAVSADEPGASRGKLLRLTDRGQQVQHEYERALRHTEASWRTTYGTATVDELRAALGELVGGGTLATSPLASGLEPQPDNWRPRRASPRHAAA